MFGTKPMVEIAPIASALFQPNLIGAHGDLGAQVRRLRGGGGAVCFLSRFVFHYAIFLMTLIYIETEEWSLPGDQHHSEASFVSHHPLVSFCRVYKRNGFDHRTDSLQGTEGKRVLRVYRRSCHCSCNRTHTEKKRDRIDANRFISSGSGDDDLAAWSKSSEKWGHGFTVGGGSEDQSGTTQGLKRGDGVLSVAVNIMMCPKLFGETFLF